MEGVFMINTVATIPTISKVTAIIIAMIIFFKLFPSLKINIYYSLPHLYGFVNKIIEKDLAGAQGLLSNAVFHSVENIRDDIVWTYFQNE